MLVVLQTLNNITAYRLLTTYRKVSLDSYCYQTTNNFKKVLDQEDIENTLIIITSIFLVICMYIGLTRLLEHGVFNTKFDVNGRLI